MACTEEMCKKTCFECYKDEIEEVDEIEHLAYKAYGISKSTGEHKVPKGAINYENSIPI